MYENFLIVVDMQNDFITGSLGSKEAQEIVPKVVERMKQAHADNECVLLTLDTHSNNYLETPEGKALPVVHCRKYTAGWCNHEDVYNEIDADVDVVIEKNHFASRRLPDLIRNKHDCSQPMRIELIGLCTDICVIANALYLKTTFPNADISVRASCCAGVTPEKHNAALEVMRSCQINIIE